MGRSQTGLLPGPVAAPSPVEHARWHRAGCAWTDRGSALLGRGTPDMIAASVGCHRRAVAVLRKLPFQERADYLADLGAACVNLGCSLQAAGGRESLGDAVEAFDKAIELLGGLPIGGEPRFRHNLAAAWMNRADALAQRDSVPDREGALVSYGRCIGLARELPLDEKASFRILLSSCFINQGNLHQRLGQFSDSMGAYGEAVAALGPLPGAGHRMSCHLAATAWTNRGEVLLREAGPGACEEAVHAARTALSHVNGRRLGGTAEALLGVQALRVMASALESLLGPGGPRFADRLAELTDVAERGMELALAGREAAPGTFDRHFAWFYCLGGRVYGRYQPQFLAEFLREGIARRPGRDSPAFADELRAVAARATRQALGRLNSSRIIVGGTRHAEQLLGTVCRLRDASAEFER